MASSTQTLDRHPAAMTNRAGKYLTFRLGDEEYGVEILHVQEIIGMLAVTHVPRTPQFVRGVINLRGKVIPVVDLRLKFDMGAKSDTEKTCIIVVQLNGSAGAVTTGFIVDEVCEVLDIPASDIEDAPNFGQGLDTDYILGMAKSKGTVKILVDIAKVLGAEEIAQLEKTA
ncbi:MAG: purine-binding chemotaxis protein CheW [Candidatus Hydrogenedentes bacterium]|nr:purine-binding chemotaxis protein CheW [Candidatus Hydrogenedentota bacterium]